MRLVERNLDSSYATQASGRAALATAANYLIRIVFRMLLATALKPKYVTALLTHWQANEHSTGTIKNLMSHVRWCVEQVRRYEWAVGRVTGGVRNSVFKAG
jgi:Phage integrase, N-terminal